MPKLKRMFMIYRIIFLSLFFFSNANAQSLLEMLDEDQAVRTKLRELPREQIKKYIDEVMLPGDKLRLEKTEEILASGSVLSAEELLAAAFIMQHGSYEKHYKSAMELARKSSELDPSNSDAVWLSSAAEDRYLLKIDKSQVWGTQLKRKIKSSGTYQIYYLENFDKSAKTDKQRLERGLPTLGELESRLLRMEKEQDRNKQYSIWKTGT